MASIHHEDLHEPLEWDSPLYRTAVAQYDQAVPYADIHPDVAERMRYPERAFIVSIPVRLDTGRRVVFAGYRVQHSSVLGPTKGGIRYDAEVTLGECAALAVWMTWKCALLRLPYGGAKGGVRCSPREMSQPELERLVQILVVNARHGGRSLLPRAAPIAAAPPHVVCETGPRTGRRAGPSGSREASNKHASGEAAVRSSTAGSPDARISRSEEETCIRGNSGTLFNRCFPECRGWESNPDGPRATRF